MIAEATRILRGARRVTALVFCCFLAFFAFLHATQAAQPLRGIALVIGNGDYQHLPRLANPVDDARAVEELLGELGFDTELSTDRDARRLARDLRNFVDDAQGADVAVIYYAGHGIEAGGQDFLVPTDADVSALEDAGKKLVPVSDVIAELSKTVRVAIVLLDACRDDPFPPGAILKLSPGAAPQPIAASGLAVTATRGAKSLAPQPRANAASLGTVIGFSAEPGKAALDGKAGTHSPYAAAILKHLGALDGAEFGTVMRMVAEEVYLKTGGRQQPWVNESLRQLLYLGKAAPGPTGDEGAILKERRQLLLTIAALPDVERKQVEAAANEAGVPMDALYGLLKSLGADAPKDPAELDRVLKAQTDRLKRILAEQATLQSPDPEITRLSKLADEALAEGALDANAKFRDEAKARFQANEKTLDQTEAELKARRLEGGVVFAKAGEAHALKADYLAAADDYEQAFQQVAKWDRQKAWLYEFAEALSFENAGERDGDNEVLRRSIAAYRAALDLSPKAERPSNWAATQNSLGIALSILGRRDGDKTHLKEAAAAFRAALEVRTRERMPSDWAQTQNNLGGALQSLGEHESDTAHLEQAAAAYQSALLEWKRESSPSDWAMAEGNLGSALWALGMRTGDLNRLEEAVSALRAALEETDENNSPLDWARAENNLGVALTDLGKRRGNVKPLQEAVAAYRAALQERTRDRVPLDWSETQNNLGSALWALGSRESGTARLKEAVAAFRAALQERTQDRVPLDWAMTQLNLGATLVALGERDGDIKRLKEAVAAFESVLQVLTRDHAPLLWANAQNSLGAALSTIGRSEASVGRLEAAIAAFRAALTVRSRKRLPLDWAATQTNLGMALGTLGELENDTASLQQAVAAYRASLQERTRARTPLDWAGTQSKLGDTLLGLALRKNGTSELGEAIAAYTAALEVRTRERTPLKWARTQDRLGGALAIEARQTGNRAELVDSLNAIASAWQVFHNAGYSQYDTYFKQRIATIKAGLAALK